jgi:LytS/YehU family sensor histidine kinase
MVTAGLPNVQSASRLSGQTIASAALGLFLVWLNLGRLSQQIALACLFVSVVGGVAIAYIWTSAQLRSVEDKGEFKSPISISLLLVGVVVIFIFLLYFANGFISSMTVQDAAFITVVIYISVPAWSFASMMFYRRWEKENDRKLFSENSWSASRLYASTKPPLA